MAQASSTKPFDTVLCEELKKIQERRKYIFPDGSVTESTSHKVRPFGVGLSGGGIRSATFNLGILQGLAEKDLLKYVDYLSTVSGGGYIGAWLHGLIRNCYNGDPREATAFLSPTKNPIPRSPDEDPIGFLRKYSNYPAPKATLFSADLWVVVLIWVRNFLLNQLILVPALCAVVLLLLIVGFAYQAYIIPGGHQTQALSDLDVLAFIWVPLGIGAIIAGANLRRIVRRTFDPDAALGDRSPDRWSLWTVPLVFIAVLVIGSVRLDWSWYQISLFLFPLLLLFQLAGGFIRTFMILRPDWKKTFAKTTALFHIVWMTPLAAAVSGGLVFATWYYLPKDENWGSWLQLAFAPTLICLSLFAGVALLQGLMGSDYPDGAREWLSRIGAMILIVCAVWTGLFLLGVFGPWAFSLVLASYGEIGLTAVGGWLLTTVGGVLAGKSAAGPAKNGANGKSIFGWLISIAPTVFMIGYLLLLAFAVHLSLRHVTPEAKMAAAKANAAEVQAVAAKSKNSSGTEAKANGKQQPAASEGTTEPQTAQQSKTPPGWLTDAFKPFATFANEYFYVLAVAPGDAAKLPDAVAEAGWSQLGCLLIFMGACVAVAWLASWRVNINEFSMHHMYKNRLVRCYLGASNRDKRKPNALTGFDPADDFSLADLLPEKNEPYYGPYPIVNTALNLNAGSELAQQERKAASFIFTPLYCGFAPSKSKEDQHAVRRLEGKFEAHGYRPTQGYSCPSGPNLGTAMAISGAAANPNSGYQTSGPMAFLLTVFDARLGWWLGNPRWKNASKYPGPLFALKYLFCELLGQTTGRTKFVNLSDGGHFDNLGLYELIRRRCRYIIIGDGEQDGDLTFGSLGGAIRKCRADFGVEIDINPNPIRVTNGFSTAHCVVGTIQYPEQETGFVASLCGSCEYVRPAEPGEKSRGWFLYLKSSLTGDEPADVIEYRSRYAKFPHESTADQFFSESQFESYRRLGLHVLRDAFEGVRLDLKDGNEKELVQVFQDLTRRWYTPIPITPEAASRLANSYSALIRSLGEKSSLGALTPVLLPNLSSTGKAGRPAIDQANLVFGLEVIQLIQNVYTEFGLQHRPNRANPRNIGWMEVFRRWVENDVFYQDIWESLRQDYNPLFQQFIEELRSGVADEVPLRP